MKYLLIQSFKDLGGAERQAINLAEHINKRGHEATIMCITEPGKVAEICTAKNIKYISFPPRNTPYVITYKILNRMGIKKLTNEEVALKGLVRALEHHISKEKYDFCISYCTTANIVLGNAKKKCKDTICLWYQGDAGIYDRLDGMQIPAVESIDEIISNGITAHDWILKAYHRETPIIYNGVIETPPEEDRTAWRKRLRATDSDIVCTMIANLTSAKDHMFLLRMLKELSPSNDRIILAFAGLLAGEYENLKKFTEDNNLSDRVRFLGHVRDVYGLLHASDICIFGAKSEGSPNGIIEGCLSNLPVIANNLPEIREAVSEENYPYLFESSNVSDAVNKLLSLIDAPETRHKLGIQNRNKALRLFNAENNFDEIMQLCENIKLKSEKQ